VYKQYESLNTFV